jgi:hypothetical protein
VPNPPDGSFRWGLASVSYIGGSAINFIAIRYDSADGFLGEAFMWMMAASVVAFAFTLKQIVFFVLLAMAFVAYGICYAIIQKRRKKSMAVARP